MKVQTEEEWNPEPPKRFWELPKMKTLTENKQKQRRKFQNAELTSSMGLREKGESP